MMLAVISFCFAACNSVGPYYGSVYRLDDFTYRVNIDTWVGRGDGWPKGSEELKRKAEGEAFDALHRVGIEVEACVFQSFMPYESGHIVACLIAGKKDSVTRWIEMPHPAFEQWLREHPGEDAVAKFEGRFPIHTK